MKYYNSKNNNSLFQLLLIIAGIITAIVLFVKKVVEKDRLLEFFISTPILILTYYLISRPTAFIESMDLISSLFYFLSPFVLYIIYWTILFSKEKITSLKANINWADKNWWWDLDGWEFEEEVAKVFRLNGYKVKVTKKTGDGGIDLIMYRDNLTFIVQCKHYKNKVEPEPVRALWGVKDDFKADKVILVASSGVTQVSKDFISNKKDYILYTLEDIIRIGLRPTKVRQDDGEFRGNKIPIPDFL